jgi:hypothetical protein
MIYLTFRRRLPILAIISMGLISTTLHAAGPDGPQAEPPAEPPAPSKGPVDTFFGNWAQLVEQARASQPAWSSPLVTTTALLEQRFRFDLAFQSAGNGSETTVIDGGKGLDLIVGPASEIQVALPPYDIRTTPSGKGEFSGWNDWAFFRFKQRLASSPESGGDYILSTWVQLQSASGIAPLSNHVFTILPTIGFGKGFAPFVIQGTVGGVVPRSHEDVVGTQFAGNLAFQYHIVQYLWPEIEVNWTHFIDGQRNGKDQVLLTPGIVIGRLSIPSGLKFTFGFGYQFAIEPHFQSSPLLPSLNHAWLVTTRFNF